VDAQAEHYERRGTTATAERWYRQTTATFQFLAENPWIGARRPSRRPEYSRVRVARVEGFERQVVVYREIEGGIEVLRVPGGRQDLDRILGPTR